LLIYHVDLKRAMWRLDSLASFLTRLQGWGFTAVLLEIEDKFRFANHPSLIHADAPPHDEWKAWSQSCQAAGLEVIPLVQSLGHLEFVLKHPEYAHLREAPNLVTHLDPTNPQSVPFVREIIDEVIEVFAPRSHFHIGGDETGHLGRSPRLQSESMDALYLRQILPILRHVTKRGLRPLLWHDMAISFPKILSKIPRKTLMVDWDYQTARPRPDFLIAWGGKDGRSANPMVTWGSSYEDNVSETFRREFERFAIDEQTRRDGTFRGFFCTDALRSKGFDVVTASANRSAGDQMGIPDLGRHTANCFWSARKGLTEGAGHIVTSWAVRRNHPETGQPATYAAVLASRGAEEFDPARINHEWVRETFGTPLQDFSQAAEFAAAGLRPLQNRDRAYGRAGIWSKCLRKLCSGEDTLEDDIKALCRDHGGRAKTSALAAQLRRNYARALPMLARCQRKAKRNADLLDFWIEGVVLQDFYMAFLQAALARRLPREAAKLNRHLRRAIATTRRFFSSTYPPHSLEEEVLARYGYHLEYLGRMLVSPGKK
jgi:hypothetical protein